MSDPTFPETVRIERVPQDGQWLLHADPADAAVVAAAIGIPLATDMLTSAASGGWSSLHLSPDEWLLISPDPDANPSARLSGLNVPVSLVDVSDRGMAVELVGTEAPAMLSGACPMDIASLADGACTRTLFGKVTVMLWHRGDRWRIAYARSYDDYVTTLLAAIAADIADD